MAAARPPTLRTLGCALLGAAALAAYLLAPADAVHAWGLNGFRSISPLARVLVLAAAVGLLLATASLRRRAAWVALAVAGAALTAFPLAESIHWLGDTSLRLHAIASAPQDASWNQWRHVLHAAPLDGLLGYTLPRALVRSTGMTPETAVSIVTLALGLLAAAAAWRIAGELGAQAPPQRGGIAFLVVAGSLEVFAGYAESAGLFLTGLLVWLAEALDPRPTRARTLRVLLCWLLLSAIHRMALLLVPALLLAVLRPRNGSRGSPAAIVATVLVVALGTFGSVALGTGRLQGDWSEWLGLMRSGTLRGLAPGDALELLAVVCPLLFLVPWIAGREALAATRRDPALAVLLAGALPLLLIGWIQPMTPSGLGVPRDWDLATPAGLLLTLVALLLFTRLPAPSQRLLAPGLVAVVAVGSLSWLAVNASVGASTSRAVSLAYDPHALPAAQRSHLFTYLGERSEDLGEHAMAGQFFGEAFTLVRNPRRAILSARAWIEAGDTLRARQALDAARARGLTGELAEAAAGIEDSLRAARAARPRR